MTKLESTLYFDKLKKMSNVTKKDREIQQAQDSQFAGRVGRLVKIIKEARPEGIVRIGSQRYTDLPEIAQKCFRTIYTNDLQFGIRVDMVAASSDFMITLGAGDKKSGNALSMRVWKNGDVRFTVKPWGHLPSEEFARHLGKLDKPGFEPLRFAEAQELVVFAKKEYMRDSLKNVSRAR